MNAPAKPRKTIWVWVIAVFYFCTGTMTFLTFVHIMTTPVEVPGEELAVIRHQLKLWTLFGLLPLANIAAGIGFFQMRRIAFHLFCGILAARLAVVAFMFLFSDLTSQITTGPGLTGTIIGFAINAAVCAYAYHLMKEGRLV